VIADTAFIHPKAHVEGSHIGPGTRIWQFASVIRGTRLGSDCNVASGATLDGPWIGDRCIISQNVAMGPGFFISDDVFIGPNVTICNDRWPHTDKTGFDDKLLRDSEFVAVFIKAGASIGANAVVLPGVVIGRKAMIAAGAVVTKNVPDNHLLHRNGDTIEIKPEWRERRMREARC
jgi:acetyltransferase-like isoleucine patch superfamily enzyme